jgi:hypothetical protein
MNCTVDGASLLRRIRNCYHSIHLLTLQCITENKPDSIPTLMHNRVEIMTLIESDEKKINEFPHTDLACKQLRDEITSIISAIVLLDRKLEMIIKGGLADISHELSTLYKKSHAVSAYTFQSRTKV